MGENRRFQRVTVNFPLASRFQGAAEISGSVCDLSLGGMKVSMPLPAPMPPEPNLWYNVDLPEPFSRLSGSGKIRWQQEDPERQRLWLGLEFATLSDEQRKDLEHIICELQEEN